MMVISRRHALMALGTLGAAPALGASAPPQDTGPRFRHGVASGDPLTDRLILWTRISDATSGLYVNWQIASDDSFARPVAQGRVWTDAASDYTVKIDATGLQAGQDYVYRFSCRVGGEDRISPVGRTRTLSKTCERAVLAVASCALYPNGYFNVYRAIADLAEVDAVVHLGDYIYEYGAGPTDYGMGNGRVLMRIPEPMHETVTLTDYRARHNQCRLDADLQAAHARAPWICVYDDHEICNNPWRDGAQNHNPGEGAWSVRKAAAIKAWREWLPVRDPPPGTPEDAIYRRFRFGHLAELIMLETRLLARSKQLDYTTDLTYAADGAPDLDAFRSRLNDPARQLLGDAQRTWLKTTLEQSVADGVRWQVFGNQVLMARVAGPDTRRLPGGLKLEDVAAHLPEEPRRKLETFADLFGRDDALPFNLDAWDGYPAERERLYDLIRDSGARAIITSGDSHTAWANRLHDDQGRPIAAEFGVTAISSPTRWLDAWLPDLHLAEILAERNPEVLAADDAYNGFLRLTLTLDMALGEWMSVDTLMSRQFTCFSQNRFEVRAPQGVAELVA